MRNVDRRQMFIYHEMPSPHSKWLNSMGTGNTCINPSLTGVLREALVPDSVAELRSASPDSVMGCDPRLGA